VAQLTDRFPVWRVEDELNPPHLRRILSALERRIAAEPAIGRERVVAAIMLLTAAMAERARQIDEGDHVELDEVSFLTNLADMIVGGLEAPVGSPLTGDR
jgi:hypothetical protein